MDDMTMRSFIERKRDGGEISADAWNHIIEAFMEGLVDDAQMSALCMACVLRGMSFDEAHALTGAMVRSGATVSFANGVVVDKHSSGGVSDIVSLVAVPLAAACGARVAKLSGRALGHTGGTIDKLETIPGFNVELELDRFVEQVERIGCAIATQTEAIVPADKRIYHLRDRTGTVAAMGLIASSIVSKKIAGGAHAFVFDVKTGAAAFMRDPKDAGELARWLVKIADGFGRKAVAFVSDMHQPLGRSIGTGIETIEARDFLLGDADARTKDLVVSIAAALVAESGIADAQARVRESLQNGSAYAKFLEMIAAQGGDTKTFERMSLLDALPIPALESGYVAEIDVVALGNAGRRLSAHEPLGGLRLAARIGDKIDKGAQLLYAYGRDRDEALTLAQAFKISADPVEPPPLIYDTISST